ncbi:ATP-dependent DNA helicase PIF1 [Artemisia annua]|uniref:ATP-dependent DNA helicase PIF1 n=1 Tax=Artemisia annua TaxID=35608 RepID=A0A2U1L0T1_ARTAN|nr:ATP-dependent DNA helicase PIF1 [Artemisia annua]
MCPQGILKVRWLLIVFEELWWRFLLWFGWTNNKKFKGSSKVGEQPSFNEAQRSHENTNINSSSFQTQVTEGMFITDSYDYVDSIYTTNFLNRIRMYSLPQHTIKLKIGSHVMLTQHINRRAGLCNGTKLQVLRLGVNVIEAKIISGENIGMVNTPSYFQQ